MPITQSAKKALRQSARRRKDNLKKSRLMKDAIKKFKKSPSPELLSKTQKLIDKTAKTNVISKNKASRLKSQLAKFETQKV